MVHTQLDAYKTCPCKNWTLAQIWPKPIKTQKITDPDYGLEFMGLAIVKNNK